MSVRLPGQSNVKSNERVSLVKSWKTESGFQANPHICGKAYQNNFQRPRCQSVKWGFWMGARAAGLGIQCKV